MTVELLPVTARFSKLPLSVPAEVGNPESRVSNVLFREDDVVCISTAPLETSTISVATPRSSLASATLSWLAETLMSFNRKLLKPLASTEILYRPGIRLGTAYVPADVVVTFTVTPVSWLVIVTGASGTTAPVGSNTCPRSVPVVLCADAGFESKSAKAVTNSTEMPRLKLQKKL